MGRTSGTVTVISKQSIIRIIFFQGYFNRQLATEALNWANWQEDLLR